MWALLSEASGRLTASEPEASTPRFSTDSRVVDRASTQTGRLNGAHTRYHRRPHHRCRTAELRREKKKRVTNPPGREPRSPA